MGAVFGGCKTTDEPDAKAPDVKVRCPECDESFSEADVKITDIEEDFRGLDVVDFECPECKTKQRSHRFTIGAAITKTEFRNCTSCGVAVAQADWYKYAPVILCQKCGMGVKFDDYDSPCLLYTYDAADDLL